MRMPLRNSGREIRQRLPEVMLTPPFNFPRDRRSQLRAVTGQHGIAAGSAKANRPCRTGTQPGREPTGLRRDQLKTNRVQRRMHHAITKPDGLSGAGKLRDEGPRLPRRGEQLEAGAADNAQRSLAADEQFHHVVAGDILYHASAAFGLAAIPGYEAHTDAIVAHTAVAVPMRAVCPGG